MNQNNFTLECLELRRKRRLFPDLETLADLENEELPDKEDRINRAQEMWERRLER
jgi:hypothetical protein